MTAQTPAGRLPNFLIIGAAKAGTTSLHHYLNQHPEIAMSRPKELNFFTQPHWRSRIHEYRSHFDPSSAITGESSPSYTLYPYYRNVAERIHELLGDVKLIYVVRDPIERAVAHWIEWYAQELEDRPFQAALTSLEDPENPYVCGSRYASQVSEYLRVFRVESLLVIDQHELRQQRAEVVRRAFNFLEVDERFAGRLDHEFNPSREKHRLSPTGARAWYGALAPVLRRLPGDQLGTVGDRISRGLSRPIQRPVVEPALRESLEQILRPDTDRLRDLTGQEFASWSV